MMTNKQIARYFDELANLMELHGENPFKIRSYQNAYVQLRKLDQPLADMSDEAIASIKGVGTAIAGKIREILDTGQMATLEKYKAVTPPGIQEMLRIDGFGPKKVLDIWKNLEIETIGELLYACNENRLVELKGFGLKTQETLRNKLQYYLRSKNKYLYANVIGDAVQLVSTLAQQLPEARVSLAGALRRCCPVIEKIELVLGWDGDVEAALRAAGLEQVARQETAYQATTADGIPVVIYPCQPGEFGSRLFRHTGARPFLDAFVSLASGDSFRALPDEAAVFEKAGLPCLVPELREDDQFLRLAVAGKLPRLIEAGDLKGIIHNHTTYSDGLHTLEEMAAQARALGYAYLVITDHSQAAFYANGLKADRVMQQWQEIDRLNAQMQPFVIFKGIESDILADGSLDYPTEILREFDFIIASVHSNLKMDEAKATQRLIRAIENPYTHLLGHPTGRLLLSREGYPIDHRKVLDACAANEVAVEINANPYRLDLDWTWIPYALEKGIAIAINPDAHSREGMHDVQYGLLAARKGGLSADRCLNALSLEDFQAFIGRQKAKAG